MGDTRYTLDELARAVGMTPRNVRSYATKRLIDKPGRQGRTAMYGEHHRAQLEWVRAMHDGEGLPLPVVRRLIERGERPETITVDLRDGALTPPAGTASRPGGPTLHASVWVELPEDDADTARVLRAVHRVADTLGYVHFEDLVRKHRPFHRLARFRRAVTEVEAEQLGSAEPPEVVLRALEGLVAPLEAVPTAVLLVGGWLVASTPDGTRMGLLDERALADALASPDVLTSPPRAVALVAEATAARTGQAGRLGQLGQDA